MLMHKSLNYLSRISRDDNVSLFSHIVLTEISTKNFSFLSDSQEKKEENSKNKITLNIPDFLFRQSAFELI